MGMRFGRRWLPACVVCSLILVSGCRQHRPGGHATTSETTDALKAAASATKLPVLRWPDFSDYAGLVQGFYAGRDWEQAWVEGRKPTPQAEGLIKLFAASGAKGLQPEDYDASRWGTRVAHLGSATDAEVAQFDLAMTVTAMRYISALHIGRVNPSHFAFGVSVDAKKYDLPQFLTEQVVGAGDVAKALAGIEPQTEEYRDTMAALGRYQGLAAKEEQMNLQPLPVPAKALAAGAAYAGAAGLRERLQLVGDLDGGASGGDGGSTDAGEAPSTGGSANPRGTGGASNSGGAGRYDAGLAEAVKHFQLRHDLPNDGRLDKKTVAELNVPLSIRVHQLEDSLERWRWLSDQYLNAPIMVNIPEFALRTYTPDHKVDFMMKVVVGDSVKQDHQTPVLTEMMKYVVMRPFWNVTPTILKQEIVPRVEKNRGYLAEKNFEVVTRAGKPVENWTAEELEHGGLMVREKPGPKNSLGLIKFMFPNKYNIYLHSTPAVQLFDRTDRDFSHGCIRVQDPEKLADWVLRNNPEWSDPAKIHDAMEDGPDNHIVPLKTPVPIVIFYATAIVVGQGPEKGQVHFFDDMYGYDKDLEGVLAGGMPYPVKPEPKEQSLDTD
jgi:murein L,D-transpeptidase YcbB/YkuD